MQKEPGQLFRVLFAFPDGNVGEVSCPDLYICHRKEVMSEVSDISNEKFTFFILLMRC